MGEIGGTTGWRRRRGRASRLGDLLGDVARRLGGGPMRRATGEAAVRRAMGPFLARRLQSFRIAGEAWVLEVADAGTAEDVRRLAPEILAGIRRSPVPAPARLVIRVGPPRPEPATAGSAPDRPPVRRGAGGQPVGPLSSAALEEVADEPLRARLARVIGHASRVATKDRPG